MILSPNAIVVDAALLYLALFIIGILSMLSRVSVAEHSTKLELSILKIDTGVMVFVLMLAFALYNTTLQSGRKSFNEGKELVCHPTDKPILVSKAHGYSKRDDYLIKESEIIALESCEVLKEEEK